MTQSPTLSPRSPHYNRPFRFEEGELLLINKPVDWTSFDVVNKVRYASKAKKVGHAGTLDPKATGLLLVATGKYTKLLDSWQAEEKTYTGIITLGATRPSYDTETEVSATFPYEHITADEVQAAMQTFVGNIAQLPPLFSAIKVGGKKLYEAARKGKTIAVEPRNIYINSFELTHFDLPHIHFRVVCSKGTYIRSLAHDLGQALHNGGYLETLCRTQSGEFDLQNAWELPDLIDAIHRQRELAQLDS